MKLEQKLRNEIVKRVSRNLLAMMKNCKVIYDIQFFKELNKVLKKLLIIIKHGFAIFTAIWICSKSECKGIDFGAKKMKKLALVVSVVNYAIIIYA